MASSTEIRINQSLPDSEAFGLRIGRLSVSKSDKLTLDSSSLNGFDCVIIDDLNSVSHLQLPKKYKELRYAGTILYWGAGSDWLASRREAASEQQAGLVTANLSNLGRFTSLCLDAFDGYVSHYAYSPTFDSRPVNLSYADWIKRSFLSPNTTLVGNEIEGNLASFALCQYDNNSLEVLLAGTGQAHRRSGAYSSLLNSLAEVIPTTVTDFTISTQATNIDVQRLWSKLGLVPLRTKTRYHLWLT